MPETKTAREDDAPLVYDYREAARLLGVSERTLRRRIDAGEVRRVMVFGMPRVEHEEIMRCIKREVAA